MAVVALSQLSGCRARPAEVVVAARAALSAQDEAAFVALCEPHAAAVLTAAPHVVAQSQRAFRVFRAGRPTLQLLPEGEIVDVVETGARAVVVTQAPRARGQVPLRLVEGQWRIDLLEMPQFAVATRPDAQPTWSP